MSNGCLHKKLVDDAQSLVRLTTLCYVSLSKEREFPENIITSSVLVIRSLLIYLVQSTTLLFL